MVYLKGKRKDCSLRDQHLINDEESKTHVLSIKDIPF